MVLKQNVDNKMYVWTLSQSCCMGKHAVCYSQKCSSKETSCHNTECGIYKTLQFFLKEQHIYIFCKFSLVNLHAETEYSMGTAEHRADTYFLKEKQ